MTHSIDGQGTHSQARRGFSLFELMLVLALIGGLAGIAMPAVMKWQQRAQLDRAIGCVQMFCAESRLQAIRSGHPVRVQMVHDGQTIQSDVMAAKNDRREVQIPAGYFVQLSSSDRRKPTNRAGSESVFFPDGTANSATFQLFDRTHQVCASLRVDELTGSVSLR